MLKKCFSALLVIALLLTTGLMSFSVQGASTTTTIYDARVSKTYSLKPNAQLSISGLTSAIQNDVNKNGVAERYIVTINGSTKRSDYVYPVLVGSKGSEAWIEESLDFNFRTSKTKRDVYGTIFVEDYYEAGEVPVYLLLISESENASFTISRVKVQAVHETAATTTTTKATTTTKKTTTTTKSTTTTTKAPANDTVIFDADVSKTLTLAPGSYVTSDSITAALNAETAAHGVAERYVVSVTMNCTPSDYVYPILIGDSGVEAWPKSSYPYNYQVGQNGTAYGSLMGSVFTGAGTAPKNLFLYAESGNVTVTLKHVKIEVVRASSATTTKSSTTTKATTTTKTTTTTKPTTTTTKPTTTTKKTTTTTKPTTTTTKKTTTTTKPTTTTTTKAPANDTVIYNAAVSKTLTLAPGKTFDSEAVSAALVAESAAHGIAERYVITVEADASPADTIYPILIGADGAEGWPQMAYSSLAIGQNGTLVGTIPGSSLAGSAPQSLFFYAESGNSTLTVRRIKIEVVRSGDGPLPTTTRTTSRPTTTGTTSGGSGSDGRPTGSGDYTVVNGVPYITFRRYGEPGTLGTWWWYTEDATNATTRDTYLNFLYMNGVDEIYFYGYYWATNNKATLHTFVQKANAKGMKVSLIYDDAASITAKGNTEMSKVATNYLNYCAAYPSDQMAGIHFDVEEGAHDNKVNYMISQFAAARARGVYIAMDVGCGWTCTATLNGISGFFNIAAANVDCLSLMSYRDDGEKVWSFGSKGFNAAKQYNCKIVFGVETDNSGEGDQVDFSGEDQKTCYTELAKVFRHLKADHPAAGYGIAVHHVRCWYNLKKG